MAVYAGAFAAFATDLAVTGRKATASVTTATTTATATVRQAVLVGAAVDEADRAVATEAAPVGPAEPAVARRPAVGIAMSLTWLALLLHGGSVLLRGLAVSRPPWGNMFEFATAGA